MADSDEDEETTEARQTINDKAQGWGAARGTAPTPAAKPNAGGKANAGAGGAVAAKGLSSFQQGEASDEQARVSEELSAMQVTMGTLHRKLEDDLAAMQVCTPYLLLPASYFPPPKHALTTL